MKSKNLSLVCSIGLVLVLVLTTVLAACAQEAAAPGAPTKISPQVPSQPSTTPATPSTPTPAKPAPAPEAEVLKWKLQAHHPRGAYIFEVSDAFAADVERLSGGRITLQHMDMGALCPNDQILKACASGLFEVGWHDPAYAKGFIPEGEIGSAPFMFQKFDDVMELYFYRGVLEFFQESYAPHGIHLIGLTSHEVIPMISVKPIRSVADYKGLKLRTIGGRATMGDALGAATTYIPLGEVYTALASGVIEAATNGQEASYAPLGWHEVAKYIIYPAMSPYPLPVNDIFVNQDKWDDLPEDLQAVFASAGDLAFFAFTHRLAHSNFEVREEYNAAGVERIWLPKSDYPALSLAASSVWTSIAEKSDRGWEIVKLMTDYMREVGYTDYDLTVEVPK